MIILKYLQLIYHLPLNARGYDGMVLAGVSIAVYLHFQFVWLMYLMCYLIALGLFIIIRDVSKAQAEATYKGLEFVGRCIRDKHDINVINSGSIKVEDNE